MKALKALTPTSGLTLQDVPVPKIGAQDVLIRIVAASLTPGVVKLLRMGQSHVPSIVGHEGAGVITELGSDVAASSSLKVGQRVRLHPLLSCGKCTMCTNKLEPLCDEASLIGFARLAGDSALYREYHDGTAAEYMRAPYWQVDPLPDSISFAVGAKLHDFATGVRSLKVADLQPDSTVVLTAPTGTMGTITLRLAKFFHIKKLILVGRSRSRMEAVARLATVPTAIVEYIPEEADNSPPKIGALVPQLKAAAAGAPIDSIIDYTPSGQSIAQILPALRTGGTLVHIGGNASPLPIPLVMIMARCWRVLGSRANTREDVAQVVSWLVSGELVAEDLISHRWPLEEVEEMVGLLDSRAEPVWLSVVDVVKGEGGK